MSLILREKPREEDLEIVIHWVDDRGRHWPTDEENRPLDPETKKPLTLNDEGLPSSTKKDQIVPGRLRFWIKMLTGQESDDITSAILKTRSRRTVSRNSRRNAPIEVEADVDISLSGKLKLKAGLVEWEGIVCENGKNAPISDKYLDLLPAWLKDDLVDRVTALTTITSEEVGE